MCCIKICFLDPEPVGAELLCVEPELIFLTWSRSRKKKYLEPEPRKMDRLRNTACYSMVLQNLHVHAVLRLQSREAETEDESTR